MSSHRIARHATLVLSCCGLAAAQPVFTDLSSLPNVTGSQALGVSPDGTTVVGQAVVVGSNQLRAFRWTRQGGLTILGVLPGGTTSLAEDVGATIVGQSTASGGGLRAFRWSSPVLIDMGVLPNTQFSDAVAVSDDGSVIVGSSYTPTVYKAFRWTAATGMVDLATIMGVTTQVGVSDVSGDGTTIVGGYQTVAGQPLSGRAYRWNGTTLTNLGLLPGGTTSSANAVSSGCEAVVGVCGVGGANHAFRWTLETGMVDLGLLPGGILAVARDVSGDGRTVVGTCNVGGSPTTQLRAFIWTQELGMQDLNTILPAMGINLGAVTLNDATAISADGTVIVGWGQDQNGSRGWVLDLRADTDGDGLLDHWETGGIPFLNDLGQCGRIALPGANPGHKDLYLEIDAMQGIGFAQQAIDLVVAAFNNAPLTNPDGTTGIHLHVLRDETDLAHIPQWPTSPGGCWPQGYDTYYDDHFGTDAERALNGSGILLRTAKALGYRYCILADRAQPLDWVGCGLTPGDKTVLFIGPTSEPIDLAAMLMHEFGHNLGLDHGGDQPIQGKPNYPSIMNYTMLYRYPWNQSFWQLDYSRGGPLIFGNLNENSLDETRGIGLAGGSYANVRMPFGVNTPGGRMIAYAKLDGSPLDFGDTLGTGIPDGSFTTGVVQDLNYLSSPPPGIILPATASPGETLTAYNDWANVVLRTLAAGGAGGAIPRIPTNELTLSAKDWIAQNFPIPSGNACYANCDGSTLAPVLNVNDFTCFVNKYAAADPYANCDGSTLQPILNVNDFSCFLNQYAAGCP